MAEIRWSLTATADLEDLEGFVARDSPVYAVRLVDAILQVVERLEAFPLSGRVVPEFEREDLREVIYSSFRIVYIVPGKTITILRIVHGARDMLRLAEREPWETII